ncbi:MAG: hypothetical protein J7J02_00820 [Sulfurovum sp.]|nr:hypothetical protein [Sulfurovum sp.]
MKHPMAFFPVILRRDVTICQQGYALHLGNTRALSHGQFLKQELKAFKRDIKAYDISH